METVIKNIAEITIAGVNVTGDVSRYLSRITYTDKLQAASDDISLVFEDTGKLWVKPWYPSTGDTLNVELGNPGNTLDCGLFEIDEIELESPPDTFTIKAIAAGISKSLRTRNSKAYEKQTLREIAQYIAGRHGLKLVGNNSILQKIVIERKTQENQTDISFLASIANEYGVIFSVRGEQLVFMDADELEAKESILTLPVEAISKMRFADKTAHSYTAVMVAHRDTKTNSVKKWDIQRTADEGKKDTLILHTRAENDSQARAKAEAAIKQKNREKITGSITVPGNTKLVSGVNIELSGLGNFSGKWHVISSVHSVDVSGYTTALTLRKIVPLC